jgi:branched-chain amino acid transport system permease protein
MSIEAKASGAAETEAGPSGPAPPASGQRRRLGVLGAVPPVVWGILALGLATLYYTQTQDSFNMFVFNRVLLACFGAIALNILMGTAGQVSIGNAAFLLIGAMSAVYFLRAGVPFPLDIICAGLVAGVVGVIVALPAVRLVGLFLALATLALQFITIFFANRYQSSDPLAASAGFHIDPLFGSKGLLGGQRWWGLVLFVLVSILLVGASRAIHGKVGRAMRIMRDHEIVAPTFGVPVVQYKIAAFAMTSMVVGFAGGLQGHFSGSVNVETFTLLISIQFIAMILVGGLDSVAGAVIGAAVVTALPAYVPKWIAPIIGARQAALKGPQIAQIIYGVLIIIFILSSQGGLVGWMRELRNWRSTAVGRFLTRSKAHDGHVAPDKTRATTAG